MVLVRGFFFFSLGLRRGPLWGSSGLTMKRSDQKVLSGCGGNRGGFSSSPPPVLQISGFIASVRVDKLRTSLFLMDQPRKEKLSRAASRTIRTATRRRRVSAYIDWSSGSEHSLGTSKTGTRDSFWVLSGDGWRAAAGRAAHTRSFKVGSSRVSRRNHVAAGTELAFVLKSIDESVMSIYSWGGSVSSRG